MGLMNPDKPQVPIRELKLLIVDDDPMVRAGLTMMLDGAASLRVVGEAGDGSEVPTAVATYHPHVVLMDLRMPRVDGVEATRRLRRGSGAPVVIVLTTFDADENVVAALRAGASGFLLKDTPPDQIVHAVHRAAAGEPILSPAILQRLVDQKLASAEGRREALAALAVLSERESEVAVAVAGGRTNAEIATDLHLSQATVKAHVSNILAKLGMDNRTQLAVLAHDAGLV
jgi:DNA-binding NarL/FixJ family response regulator